MNVWSCHECGHIFTLGGPGLRAHGICSHAISVDDPTRHEGLADLYVIDHEFLGVEGDDPVHTWVIERPCVTIEMMCAEFGFDSGPVVATSGD